MGHIQDTEAAGIGINSRVLVRFQSGDTLLVTIVQSTPPDPGRGIISSDSPLGKALLGKKKGDRATYIVGSSMMQVDVVEVYP